MELPPAGPFYFLFTVTNDWGLNTTALGVIVVTPPSQPTFLGVSSAFPYFNTTGGETFSIIGTSFRTYDTPNVTVTYGRVDLGVQYAARVCDASCAQR